MSRKKKSPEERLIDIVAEIGPDAALSAMQLIVILWKKPGQSTYPIAKMPAKAVSGPKRPIPEAVGDKP